jgi:hypothetical protein
VVVLSILTSLVIPVESGSNKTKRSPIVGETIAAAGLVLSLVSTVQSSLSKAPSRDIENGDFIRFLKGGCLDANLLDYGYVKTFFDKLCGARPRENFFLNVIVKKICGTISLKYFYSFKIYEEIVNQTYILVGCHWVF